MPTSIVSITFMVGLALMVLALLGGGIKVKEIEIPKLPVIPRILSFFTGCAFLALLFLRPDIFQVFSDNKILPVSPQNPPPMVNPSPPPRESETKREEQDEVERLRSAAYDKSKLTPLASDAHSPEVRDEARQRLVTIDKEEQSLKSAAYDEEKLIPLASDAHSPEVQAEARERLITIDKEEQSLKSAAYDREKLTRLASDAHSPQVQAEARERLNTIDKEEESLKSAAYDREKLTRLAGDARSPQVQAEASRRLAVIPKELSEAAKKNTAQEDASNQPQQFETPAPKSVSSLMGYTLFAVIDKNNNIKKQFLNIDGKPDQKFPAPNDTVIAAKQRPIVAIPYHWDTNSGTIVHPSEKLTDLKEGQKAKVGGDIFISSDPNGDRYVIAPISSLIGTDYTGAKSKFTPIVLAPNVLGYVYIGRNDDKSNKFNFLNRTHPDVTYPATNDDMVATTDVWLHAGPRHWDAAKQENVDTERLQMIKSGQRVVVGGDSILASGGTSIWTPIAAINPETPAPAAQAPKPLRDTLLAPVQAANAPTFPCTGSLSPVEALICNDPELAKLDVELDRTYRKALNALLGDQKQQLISEQRVWIKKRAACADNGAIRKCVEDAVGRRLSSLRSRYGSDSN